MRKLIALLLTLALLAGLVPAAFAASPYVLDIYWIANRDDPEIRAGVEAAINEYLAELHKADRNAVAKMEVSIHLIDWGHWDTDAMGDLMADKKIDLIFTADWKGYVEEILADKLLPLNDQLDSYGKGIKETLSQDFLEGVKYSGSAANGSEIYGIPTNKEICVPSGLIVNKTAALSIGWDPDKDPVKSTEELEPYLQKYKEMYPDKYPYLMEKGRWSDEPWGHEWIGLPEDVVDMKYAMDENGKYDEEIYNIFEQPEQEEHIRLMYRWAQAGYIDPQAEYWDSENGYNTVFGKGDFLVFTQPLKGHNIKCVEMYAEKHDPTAPEFECTEIILQDKYLVTCQAGGSMFAIPKTGRADCAMQYLNLMHTDEKLVNLMLFGVEGVNYTKVNDRQVELNQEANWYGLHGGAWTVGNTKLQYVLTTEDPEKNALLQQYAEEEPKAEKTASYGFRFNKSKAATLDAVTEVVNKFTRPLMVGAVNPDDPERGLEAFRQALRDAGVQELIDEVRNQYDEWKAAQK